MSINRWQVVLCCLGVVEQGEQNIVFLNELYYFTMRTNTVHANLKMYSIQRMLKGGSPYFSLKIRFRESGWANLLGSSAPAQKSAPKLWPPKNRLKP